MTALVIGANGYLGSHATRALVTRCRWPTRWPRWAA